MGLNMTADVLNDHDLMRVNSSILEIEGLDVELALESFPIPKQTIGIIEVGHLNEKRKFAGNPVFEDISVIYKDLVTADVKEIIKGWWQEVYNATTGAIGLARDYKRGGMVRQYGPGGQGPQMWDLIGMWPSSFDPGDADMSGEDFLRITLTLTIDKVIPGNLAAIA